ncbi:dTDP-4-dehydrorhamnose reductase [Flavobacterium silvaticum]|uniref:dTDP-4-dehydrorhamnose reductase n=1 Tax=Flavobacterium silvaticum TaxID=1852020 RepID=A0A972JGN8_9FLAO|nr:dTDP-4-dehydrorhamnose reductase [Flavobacterium silvaticum]NMH28391.1 dTDP-4-dehydrorhamnose reductase [Flavobacterium silvaticum]
MVILVTGSGGQLGQALQYVSAEYPQLHFIFADSKTGDITHSDKIRKLFSETKPDFCINAAAYTAVDKAESEPEKAQLINVDGARNLAKICSEHNTTLIHISTDFVFDGQKSTPYSEDDATNPTGIYGRTKRDGENAIEAIGGKYFIIRTSWVYSQFGNNFMKTMLRLASERDSLNVVNDQIGTPTNAVDLAKAILTIIKSCKSAYGIYNFSNEGVASWFDFAAEIFRVNHISINLKPIPTEAFPTTAKRPAYSVLDKSKIKEVFGIEIDSWKSALSNISKL